VVFEGAGKVGAGEELVGIFVVLGRGAGYDLLKCYRELVRIKGPAFPDFLPGSDYFIPGVHSRSACSYRFEGFLGGSTRIVSS